MHISEKFTGLAHKFFHMVQMGEVFYGGLSHLFGYRH